jgi:hypothetical protein
MFWSDTRSTKTFQYWKPMQQALGKRFRPSLVKTKALKKESILKDGGLGCERGVS